MWRGQWNGRFDKCDKGVRGQFNNLADLVIRPLCMVVTYYVYTYVVGKR
jgi:hypothetical protein